MEPEREFPPSAFRVLVVEDEFLIGMELKAVLTTAGFQVLGPVASVTEALGLIQTQPPNAAVLDVSLRGERVTPVAELLLLLKVPYVLTSAYQATDLTGEPSLATAKNLGKPTIAAELVKAVRELCTATTPG